MGIGRKMKEVLLVYGWLNWNCNWNFFDKNLIENKWRVSNRSWKTVVYCVSLLCLYLTLYNSLRYLFFGRNSTLFCYFQFRTMSSAIPVNPGLHNGSIGLKPMFAISLRFATCETRFIVNPCCLFLIYFQVFWTLD